MARSDKGKAASEWSAWMLAYDYTLRQLHSDLLVNGLDLDVPQLKICCECGEDPVATARRGFVPLRTKRATARVGLQLHRHQAQREAERVDRLGRLWLRGLLAACVAVCASFGYLGYRHWSNIESMREAEQAKIEWRHSIGLE